MTRLVRDHVLRRARALIAEQSGWTRGVLSRTASGRPVTWHAEDARCWCAVGALHRAAYDLVGDIERAAEIADAALAASFPPNLTWINDTQGHDAVLRLFDQALRAPHLQIAANKGSDRARQAPGEGMIDP
jgi:hypothetical protein